MTSLSSQFPDHQVLTNALSSILSGGGSDPIRILDRSPLEEGSFLKEIVTCSFDDGTQSKFFCKYTGGFNHNCHGHRGGVAYEAAVYQNVLLPLKVTKPVFYGSHISSTSGEAMLVIEHLDDALRINKHEEAEAAMTLAARWIGEFHSFNESRICDTPDLNFYDAKYYLGWAARTAEFAGELHSTFPWLVTLCSRFEEIVPLLLVAAPTVIHGEYYPRNILFRDGTIYPVDWESAAIGAGEIDLVTLTEAWPKEVVRECESEYRRARWPSDPPTSFERTLAAARLYLQFRWLGDQPGWTTARSALWRFEELRIAGERLGLI